MQNDEKRFPKERSGDGHQPNWSPPLSLWPSSRPLPIKPNPLSTTLPLTHPSRAPLPTQSSLPRIRLSISLYYYPSYPPLPHTITHTPIPTPCRTRPSLSKRVFPPTSSRSPVSPTRSPRCPKQRTWRKSQSTTRQCPGSTPRRVKQKCVLPLSSLPLSPRYLSELPSSQLKKALSNNVGAAQTLAYATSVSRSRRPSDCARALRTETCLQPANLTHNQPSQGLMMKKPVSFLP